MRTPPFRRLVLATALMASGVGTATAAEGFKVRFPLSGTLGGEIVAPLDNPGLFGSIVVTRIDIDKVTDDAGNPRSQTVTGTFLSPAPIAGSFRSATYSGLVTSELKQKQTNANLILGYLSNASFGGGRLSVVLNLPYTTQLDRKVGFSGPTPTLGTLSPALNSPPLPAGTAAAAQAQVQSAFGNGYQAQLAAQSAAGSGEVDGFGDAEITGAWVYRSDALKFVAGLTLVLPTGDYNAGSQINIGFGNFYTLRPGLAVAWNPTPNLTLGARGSLGFNTRNKDNHLKSGDFSALDLAAAWRTRYGVFGPHVLVVQQFEDDNGGTLGGNRFKATGVGAFYTALIPGIDAAVNLSYMKMVDARNALSGSFVQVRISKAF